MNILTQNIAKKWVLVGSTEYKCGIDFEDDLGEKKVFHQLST